ncbi:hypothetical protein SAMD00019534_084180 [Acytostelium subglobosum LB1]|uniref:hypothetical protein n=1 Tax=Acytostelium subglobosum LB1 TaxID=1410327 RepID=UPI0006447C9E|nr:hypothetical protein SAMD00019534_084180 [Acytostelium subglobosum LB1]GAM25243.1 hypothetical protein SAMD00019534_084180 [Acytostelium subglobosum LB1]|eukprot:XP_012751763.1 hypothetical protein SAMD00019534_084180 [Acytostelium subglobosum LB1]
MNDVDDTSTTSTTSTTTSTTLKRKTTEENDKGDITQSKNNTNTNKKNKTTSTTTSISSTSSTNNTTEEKQQDQQQKKKKNNKYKGDFIYGNYRRYYDYRIEKDKEDPRMSVLPKELFYNKMCLDVGCNSGLVTLKIARDYQCDHIKGIDIDHQLIKDAVRNLKTMQTALGTKPSSSHHGTKSQAITQETSDTSSTSTSTTSETTSTTTSTNGHTNGNDNGNGNGNSNVINTSDTDFVPISFKYIKPTTTTTATATAPTQKLPRQFPHNISFIHHNIMADSSFDRDNSLDVILALSVTKWLHLNWGDNGIKSFFNKVYRMLKPGGSFIMEPQEFQGYKRRQKLSPAIKQNYSAIQFKPEQFIEHLTNVVGFKSCEELQTPDGVRFAGFKRNIYRLIK